MSKWFILIGLSLFFVGVSPFIGDTELFFAPWDEEKKFIFYQLRMPRVLTGFIVGAALSLAGLLFQGLFRNQLATPYTLGVSAASAFMACVWIKLGLSFDLYFFSGISLAGFLGSLLSVVIIFLLANILKRFDASTLILAGLAQGMFFSSGILLFQFIGNVFEVSRIIRWTVGGVEVVGYQSLIKILPLFLMALIISLFKARGLNLLFLGEELAISRGVRVEALRKLLFLLVSLMVGVIIAETGPIAFIGLIAPHTMRQFFGGDYRKLIPSSVFSGGLLLVVCDLIGRSVSDQIEIPVGIVTAFIGGPFFLYILLRRRSE